MHKTPYNQIRIVSVKMKALSEELDNIDTLSFDYQLSQAEREALWSLNRLTIRVISELRNSFELDEEGKVYE